MRANAASSEQFFVQVMTAVGASGGDPASLGDVIHHLPAVTDLAEHRPGARIAWAVEEAYADLVTLHPAVAEAIPVGLRGLHATLSGARRLDPVTRLGQRQLDELADSRAVIDDKYGLS